VFAYERTRPVPSRPSLRPRLGQRSFDDLGTPLHEVTFCVLDLETTGGSPAECAITEIGAVKLRGGECLGRFETLVNPGMAIPPLITVLTGITEAMVLPAPHVDEVLPSFLEFLGGAVIVGHNVRFDIGFLDAALLRRGRGRLTNRRIDTLAIARRLLRDDVPNLRLQTLARHLRVPTEPTHRAMPDAQATAEVLHALLERAAAFGVLGLDDLLALPSMYAHPSSAKLGLTSTLPRAPGVYLFRDRAGRVLYVGKATNLRARVRSYFAADDRRKVPQLLREAAAVDHYVCGDALEAAVREIRLIQRHEPRFNRQGKAHRHYAYVKLTAERLPRLTVTRVAPPDGGLYLGPLPSAAAAQLVKEAIESALPLRRCTQRIGRRAVLPVCATPCTSAQLGVAACPCAGQIDEVAYDEIVAELRVALTADPRRLLEPLEARMHRLATAERFEEAALTRDRLGALVRALARRDTADAVRRTPRVQLVRPDRTVVEVRFGRLVIEHGPGADDASVREPDLSRPPARDEVDELLIVARALAKSRRDLALVDVEGTLASRVPSIVGYALGTRGRERDRERGARGEASAVDAEARARAARRSR
jgi:DNA polymerase-3 subunit epsilon